MIQGCDYLEAGITGGRVSSCPSHNRKEETVITGTVLGLVRIAGICGVGACAGTELNPVCALSQLIPHMALGTRKDR